MALTTFLSRFMITVITLKNCHSCHLSFSLNVTINQRRLSECKTWSKEKNQEQRTPRYNIMIARKMHLKTRMSIKVVNLHLNGKAPLTKTVAEYIDDLYWQKLIFEIILLVPFTSKLVMSSHYKFSRSHTKKDSL